MVLEKVFEEEVSRLDYLFLEAVELQELFELLAVVLVQVDTLVEEFEPVLSVDLLQVEVAAVLLV